LSGYLLKNSLIWCTIAPWSANYVSSRSGHRTHPNRSDVCLQANSAEPLPGNCDATRRMLQPLMWFMLHFRVAAWEPSAGN
jgi:hypothetical protein